MFTGLADKLNAVFDKLTRRGILTEEAVDETMREIKIALIEADVALPVVKNFVASVRERAIGEKVIRSVSPAQMVVKIVNDALVDLLGESKPLALNPRQQNVILVVGLQGSGKTTSCAKLAKRLQKDGKKVLLASLDTYRPAAQEQLAELGQSNGLTVLPIVPDEKPLKITERALKEATSTLADVLILDTAGRLHIDEEMMQEVAEIRDLARPVETLLVVDALMGQDAVQMAEAFRDKIGVTGTILTRIDGDSRGGAALSMRAVTGVPVQFLGVGEKADALEVFDAKRIAGRILGMGDVVGLVETAMEKMDQEKAHNLTERMMQGKFDLNDLLGHLQQIQNLGDIKGIMKMIPGINRLNDKLNPAQMNPKEIKRQEAIILSMTPYERRNPDVLKASRKQRIANGAGVSVNEVNRLLKQYDYMANIMKKFNKMGPLGMVSLIRKLNGFFDGKAPFMNGGGFSPF